ncbi:MAG: hypothetical protein QM743_08825 [Chitinophagaceae bacterium]
MNQDPLQHTGEELARLVLSSSRPMSIGVASDIIGSELYKIYRSDEKRRALYIMKSVLDEQYEYSHRQQEFNHIFYAINQEIESLTGLSDDYNDTFSATQQHEIIKALNDIIEKQNIHDELLFNEIQELKNMLNLPKKNWKQLLVGKLAEMVAAGGVSELLAKSIHSTFTHMGDDMLNLIGQ